MHHPSSDPIFGTVLMTVLAVASGVFGFLEHLDMLMGIVAKLIAILAGCASLVVAYQTYILNRGKVEKSPHTKPLKK